MKKVTLIILVGLISLTACKKYDEGPLISLRSKENRLCQKWKLYDAYWNGEPAEIKNTLIEFSKDGKYHSISNISFATTVEENYNWQFINKKNDIEIFGTRYEYETHYDSTSQEYVVDSVLTNFKTISQIIKLTQKELWFDQDTVIYNEPTKLSFRFKQYE